MKKSNMKMKVNSIFLSLMCMLLISTPYIAQRSNNIIKLCLELALIILIIANISVSSKCIKKNVPIIVYFIAIVVSTYINHGFASRTLNAIITGGAYVLFYFLTEVFSEKHSNVYVASIVRNNFLFYMIILDFLVIITRGEGLGGFEEAVYLIGNKFMLSYLHMAILALINLENRKLIPERMKRIRIIGFFFYSAFILYIADTTTGLIGCAFVAAFMFIFQKKPKWVNILSKPIMPLIFFLGLNAIFLLTDLILNNSLLTEFFLARSHTSTILSGRVPMYRIAMTAISQNPVWGYGLNYDIVEKTLSFGNAQNGLLKSLLDFGIIGTIAFILVLFMTFRNAEKSNGALKTGYIAFVYGMILCSLVEVNLAAIFMLVCACMNSAEIGGKKAVNIRIRNEHEGGS